jgi:hypothetical protein
MGCALCICGCRRAWVNSFRGENFVVASALAHGKFDVRPRGSGLDLMAAASASSAVGVGTSRMHLGAVVTGDTHAHVGIADAHAIGDICSAAVWGAVWGSSSICHQVHQLADNCLLHVICLALGWLYFMNQ